MGDAETVTQGRRRLGRALASHRRAAGYNQHQLAARIGYGRSTVANVETGRQHAVRGFWERCDRVLGVDGVLLGGYDELEAVIREHHRSRGLQEVATNRRDATRLLTLVAAGGAGSMVDFVEHLATGPDRVRVDRKLIVGHQEIAENLASLYRGADPRSALPMAVTYADGLLDLLDTPMGDREYRELIRIAVGVHAQVGLWACHLHRSSLAYRYLATACDLAASTRDPGMHARALGAFSYLFSSAPRGGRGGKPGRALALLDAGLARAERADGFTRGWLATWRADQHATLGRLEAARADIDTAARGLASGDNPEIGGFFSRPHYGYGFQGHVVRLRALISGLQGTRSDLDDMAVEMVRAATNLRHQVGALGYLATVCVTADEPQRACSVLSDSLARSLSAGYAMAVGRTIGVRAAFPRSWSGLSFVRDLDELLRGPTVSVP